MTAAELRPMSDLRELTNRLMARADISNKASRFGEGSDLETAALEIRSLRGRLLLIADIAEGSGTINSLPHIAKIARGDNT